jgi:dihydrofolate reductase
MSKVIADMSMSIDGRIATPDDDISLLAGWFFAGDTEVAPGAPFRTSAASAELLRQAMANVGAIVGGRRYFDLADGWGGAHPMGVPVVILTHEPPADWPADSTISFATDGLAAALDRARTLAQGKDIAIATPDVVRQCLEAGVLDELQVNIAPIVLGEGPLFFQNIARHVVLDDPEVVQGTRVTHLRYRVRKDDNNGRATPDAAAQAVHDVAQAGR